MLLYVRRHQESLVFPRFAFRVSQLTAEFTSRPPLPLESVDGVNRTMVFLHNPPACPPSFSRRVSAPLCDLPLPCPVPLCFPLVLQRDTSGTGYFFLRVLTRCS